MRRTPNNSFKPTPLGGGLNSGVSDWFLAVGLIVNREIPLIAGLIYE